MLKHVFPCKTASYVIASSSTFTCLKLKLYAGFTAGRTLGSLCPSGGVERTSFEAIGTRSDIFIKLYLAGFAFVVQMPYVSFSGDNDSHVILYCFSKPTLTVW